MAKALKSSAKQKSKNIKTAKVASTGRKPAAAHRSQNGRLAVVIVLVILLAAGVSAFVANNLKPQVNAEGISVFHSGQTASVEKFNLKLNKISSEKPTDATQKGNKYIVLNLSMKNRSSTSTLQVAPQLKTYVKDQSGTTYTLRYIPPKGQPFTGSLSPNDNVTGDIGFVVPESAKGLRFYYEADAPAGKPVIFELN